MRYHRSLMLALVTLPLLAPGAASAKEVTRAKVCGATDCVAVTDRGALRALLYIGPAAADGPQEPASYYELRMTMSAGQETHTSTLVYLPAAELVGTGAPGGYDWYEVGPGAATVLDAAATRLEPLPGPVVRGIPLGRTTAAATTGGGGFPWPVLAVLVCMLGACGFGWAGQRRGWTKSA
jgi:hypothetical protein